MTEEQNEGRSRRPRPRPSTGAAPGGRPKVAGLRAGRHTPQPSGASEPTESNRPDETESRLARWRRRRAEPTEESTRPDRRRLAIVVSAVLVVAFAVSAGILGMKLYDGRVRVSNRADALRVLPRYASQVLSFDYRHLDANSAAARPLLSGSYRTEYTASMTKNAAQWRKYHYVVKSKVASAGVSAVSGSKAVVVAFVDQTVSAGTATAAKKNGKAGKPKTGTAQDLIRLQFTLQREHGEWLLTKLDPL